MTEPRPRSTRPRDRKQQIIAAASEQFRASGFHNVGISDIAEAVGISGPAVYRHFRGKQELLYATLADAIDKNTEAFRGEYGDLRELLDAVAVAMLERRHTGVLWERELAHLAQEQRQELRARYVATIEPLRAAIAASRPDLSADSVELLLRAVIAVFATMSQHAGKAEPARARQLMTDLAGVLCAFRGFVPREDAAGERRPTPRGRLLPVSRRQAVLAVATRLFAERGYEAVGMEDIATAAGGMAGPSLYHHFAGKSAILVAALTRCLEALLFDLSAALEYAERPGQALDAALHSFVRVSLQHGDAMRALLHEIVNVPAEERQNVRRMQHDYVTEWTALLSGHRPELSPAEAELLVHTAHSVVTTLSHDGEPWTRQARREEIIALSRTVLGLPVDAPSAD
ncbi:TetR/AcrR family transcriptional regulator [Streptomyces sp. MSC1_001]|jgi:AcrR family transcriptional regulator|uniref:TetR/AcrR family transcriptional regulator n=1 Tax=Streptomyces sp. MSC1_001 TaxID=2909263 RepID=UPI00202E321A|nr:TetR/AcrR family transcriptional regulator [Streptomyces sp. MSC1_001]